MADTPLELIEKTNSNIKSILDEVFPGYSEFGEGQYTIERGSTIVMIVTRPFLEDDLFVECMANVVTGADITPELMKFLLRKNSQLHFGAFGLLFDDTIVFQHTISGANLDKNELVNSVNAVANIADFYDDEIVAIAGGKRAKDLDAINLD